MALVNLFGQLGTEQTQISVRNSLVQLQTENWQMQNLLLSELQTQQRDAITNAELRAAPVDVNITSSIPVGLTNSELRASPIETLIVNQLTEYPLPQSQINSLTPQTNSLTNAELRASPVVVDASGSSVSITNFPATYDLSSSQLNTLTPQKNALTNTELRASPVTVNTQLVQSLTDAQLRASPVNVNTGHSQALTNAELRAAPVVVDTGLAQGLTDSQLRAADVNTADSGEREYTHVPATITNTGDTVVYTPAVGKRIRLRWIYAINDPTAATTPVISVKLGTQEIYRVYALSKRQRVTGPINGQLIINLSVPGNVQVTALIEEI